MYHGTSSTRSLQREQREKDGESEKKDTENKRGRQRQVSLMEVPGKRRSLDSCLVCVRRLQKVYHVQKRQNARGCVFTG